MEIVNNRCYDLLGDRWYHAQDDPVAMLRAEGKVKQDWIDQRINANSQVLDVGCGAGFLTNFLSLRGHSVTGLDSSIESLDVARTHDISQRVTYVAGDALRMPFDANSFDVVCAMDFLEHVENPGAVISEAARVLKPGGKFFFYTFNRNPLAWFVVIKGMEWFVKNTPPRLHVLRLFIKPKECRRFCGQFGLEVAEMAGIEPVIFSRATYQLLRTGIVPNDFQFRLTPRLWVGYIGMAVAKA